MQIILNNRKSIESEFRGGFNSACAAIIYMYSGTTHFPRYDDDRHSINLLPLVVVGLLLSHPLATVICVYGNLVDVIRVV